MQRRQIIGPDGKPFGKPVPLESMRTLERNMRERELAKAQEKQAQRDAYLDQEVTCPCCKKKGKVRDLARNKSRMPHYGGGGGPTIDYLVCKVCRVHFDAPDGEVVLTQHDNFALRGV